MSLRRAMLSRLCAVWLVVLAALPFTAPFAALDVADFLGSGHVHHTLATVSKPIASNHVQDDDADDVAATDVCFLRAHPLTLVRLVPVTSPVASAPIPSEILNSVVTIVSTYDDASALVVALRV